MKLDSTRSDIFGFRHSTVGMLCGAAGSLAGAALMAGVPHPAVVSVAGSVLLALFGVDTVYATWRGPRGTAEQPLSGETPPALNQILGVNRRQMATYSMISAAFAAAGAGLAADTAGATRVGNFAGVVVTSAGAIFFAAYVLLGDRASVRLSENGVADSTRPWRRTFVPWADLTALSLQPLPGTSPQVLLHVRQPDGGEARVPVQTPLMRGGARAVVEAITAPVLSGEPTHPWRGLNRVGEVSSCAEVSRTSCA